MGKWADRLAALEAEISRAPPDGTTDRTDKTRVLSVLAVPQKVGTEKISVPATVPVRGCTDCAHRLPRGTCARPEAAGLIPAIESFGIVWPDPGHAAGCEAFEASASKATGRPYRLAPADADVAHAEPWDDAAIARFQARVRRIRRRGFDEQDANDLAERLHLRDVQANRQVLCLECAFLAGSVATGWRCGNHRTADVAREVSAELVTLMQACHRFAGAEAPEGQPTWR